MNHSINLVIITYGGRTVQIFGYSVLLLWCLGPSVLIGIGALLATIPINIKVFEK
jgi:hypothetical protein